jgi:hypothetical protein
LDKSLCLKIVAASAPGAWGKADTDLPQLIENNAEDSVPFLCTTLFQAEFAAFPWLWMRHGKAARILRIRPVLRIHTDASLLATQGTDKYLQSWTSTIYAHGRFSRKKVIFPVPTAKTAANLSSLAYSISRAPKHGHPVSGCPGQQLPTLPPKETPLPETVHLLNWVA